MIKEKNDMEKIDFKLGIYTITGLSMLVYIFWMLIEDATYLAHITLVINLAWYFYSRRLLRVYADAKYAKNYTVNYMLCIFVCFLMYIFNISMPYRNPCIFIVSCEGFVRTFLIEIRLLVKESKELARRLE